jgi:hypothetical protein
MSPFKSAFTIVALLYAGGSNAQLYNITKTAQTSAVNQANNAIYNDVNQGVNSVFQAPGKIFRKIKAKSQQSQNTAPGNTQPDTNSYPNSNPNSTPNSNPNSNPDSTPSSNTNSSSSTISPEGTTKVTQGYDFKAGSEVIFSENFAAYNPGDFPDRWTTNGAGEVRTVEGQEGKWLQISSDGIFALTEVKDLPENFTFEFDAIFNPAAGKDVHYIVYLYSVKDKVADFKETNYPGNAGIYFAFNTEAGEVDAENFENGKAGIIDLHLVTDLLKASLSNRVHVALARQKSKISLYINGNRIFSSPSALSAGYTYNGIKFGSFFMGKEDFMLLSNLKVATN